jgi:pimeloyl-ACP methyl ester carboxylesterase
MKITQKIALTYIRSKFQVLAAVSSVKAANSAFTLFCTPYQKSKKQASAIFNSAEKIEFPLEADTIRGFRWNSGAARRLLILHGFSSCVYNFDKYISIFVKKGYEVLAFDAPAHGRSSGKTVNAVLYKEMIVTINKLYGTVNSYMAHSFGGIALSLAMEELPHDETVNIALVAPATETVTAVNHAFGMLGLKNPKVRAGFDDIIYRLSGHETAWFSIRRAAKNIRASVLWIHDEEDDVTPVADAKKVQDDNLPNIKFVITKGLGHQKIYRDATTRKMIADFL